MRRRIRNGGVFACGAMLWAAAILAIDARGIGAQESETIPGVRLGLLYEGTYQPVLAIKPFSSRFGGARVGPQVQAIIGRDLRYSDRFEILDSLPETLMGPAVDYQLWDQLGTDWLVSGQVEGSGQEYVLILQVHDVVYGEVKAEGRFPVPDPAGEGFRMAVHLASDAVVKWITGEPGMAATRIAFSQSGSDGNQDLFLIDSDGENLRRLTRYGTITLSPTWSPDGKRIAYTSFRQDDFRIFELDLETGEERQVSLRQSGQQFTPAYHPDGRSIAFAVTGAGGSGLYTFDMKDNCCLTNLTGGRWDDISPSYSPDGTRLVFNSSRLGTATPQIYVMPAGGGEADLVSPYVFGQGGYYTSPDWSPVGDRIAFHGRIRRGRYQILVAEVQDRGHRVIQLTAEGNNEDPSWAPDGRHLVFTGERSYGFGLFVVDAVTGRLRTLLSGIRAKVPEWSPTLGSLDRVTLRGG